MGQIEEEELKLRHSKSMKTEVAHSSQPAKKALVLPNCTANSEMALKSRSEKEPVKKEVSTHLLPTPNLSTFELERAKSPTVVPSKMMG